MFVVHIVITCFVNSDKESYFEVWMFLIYIVIVYFIKYELDQFELNWVNVYVWYDTISMIVSDMEWWSRHSIFRKGYTHVEIVRICIILWIWSKEWQDYWIHIDKLQ